MKSLSRTVALAIAAVVVASAFACSSTTTTNGASSGSSTGATADQLNRCHGGCDKMKFFECTSAAELSKCYSDCDSAPPKSIDVFIACAENSVCDPACRTNITPAPSTSSSGASGTAGGSGGGGVSAASCQTACTKIITTCSLAPVGQMQACVDACTKNGFQYQIDCVVNNQCGDIISRCGGTTTGGSSGTTSGGTSGTASGGTSGSSTSGSSGTTDPGLFTCQSNCDFMFQRSCITAAEQSTCRAKCASDTSAKRDTFNSCANAPDCAAAHDCFTVYTGP
jgi:hypothetical protein